MHCPRLERSIYRDSLDLYYDKEAPLWPDLDRLSRRLQVHTDEEKAALQNVLDEFFTLEADGYHNARCDAEIKKYHDFINKQSQAGKASVRARRKKSAAVEPVLNGGCASVEPSITHTPDTKNHIKNTSPVPSGEDTDPVVTEMPTNSFNTQGEEFQVTESMVTEWQQAYPSLDITAELPKIRTWLLDNQPKRKTARGMRKFIGSWLARQHDQGRPTGAPAASSSVHALNTGAPRKTRDISLHESLTDTSWAN